MRRRGDFLEKSIRKLTRTGGEPRGVITREVITAREAFVPGGAMVDAIGHVEWEN